jgi:thermostable 8-oxoguanine DNA glycosylase
MSDEATPRYSIKELKDLYDPIKGQIDARLGDFRQIWEKANDEELFC